MEFVQVTVVAILIASGIVAWLEPWAGIAFVVNGSVLYYAGLDAVNGGPSALLTGSILLVPGGIAVARLVMRRGALRRLARSPFAYLFSTFILIWYARWIMDPPAPTEFGSRALAYMLVLAVIPFVAGLCVQSANDMRRALVWFFGFGMAGLLIMIGYWIAGAPTQNLNGSGRWEPIPFLAGGLVAVDLAVTCLAFLALWGAHRPKMFFLASALTALAFALDVRIGSRGPFLFLPIGIAIFVLIVVARFGIRRGAATGVGLAIALLLAFRVAAPAAEPAPPLATPVVSTPQPTIAAPSPTGAPAETAVPTVPTGATAVATAPSAATVPPADSVTVNVPRVAQAEGYFSPADRATKERLEILGAAIRFIGEKPLFGWGGGLVGRDINGHPWDYSHTILLDPLVETGIVGALPFWALFALVALGAVMLLRQGRGGALELLMIAPVIVFVSLESFVSGNVAVSRHLWFFLGVTCGLLTLARTTEWRTAQLAGPLIQQDTAPRTEGSWAVEPHGGERS